MIHNLDVLYSSEDATDRVSMDRWNCWADTDGDPPIYYADGPCPGCEAVAHGIATRDPGPFPREDHRVRPQKEPSAIEIFLECHCGHEHGEPGAYGCGRTWVIQFPGKDRDSGASAGAG